MKHEIQYRLHPKVVAVLNVLLSPISREILEYVLQRESVEPKRARSDLRLDQSTLRKHLNNLENCGLVNEEIDRQGGPTVIVPTYKAKDLYRILWKY